MARYPAQKTTFPSLPHKDEDLANEMLADVLHEISRRVLER